MGARGRQTQDTRRPRTCQACRAPLEVDELGSCCQDCTPIFDQIRDGAPIAWTRQLPAGERLLREMRLREHASRVEREQSRLALPGTIACVLVVVVLGMAAWEQASRLL